MVWEVGHEVNFVVWSQRGLAFVASDALLGIFHQAKVSRGITQGSDWKIREASDTFVKDFHKQAQSSP